MSLLSDTFLNKYKNIESPLSPIGQLVYYRTYSRFLPELSRRENWLETCKRAVEYNCSLDPNLSIKEAESLFDNMFNLRQFLSGRTLWIGGTEACRKHPSANYNCAFTVINSIDSICDLFYLMTCGCGVGFRVLEKDTDNLPLFYNKVKISHKNYVENTSRQEETQTSGIYKGVKITVGDSKDGWVEALRQLLLNSTLNFHTYHNIETIYVDYDNVRPAGQPLKTFGGTASGYESLRKMFEKIIGIINKSSGKLQSVDILDICNIVGENVAVGGVRRTASICLFDIEDEDVLNAKNKIFYKDENGIWQTNEEILHRTKSNNSILFKQKPTKEKLEEIFKNIKTSGEPGFVNWESGLKRFPDMAGGNPCFEILLPDKGFCNLVTLNMVSFVNDGVLSKESLLEACKLNARASLRMASINIELPEWQVNMEKYRLIGCSLTGWQDSMNLLQLSEESKQNLLQEMKHTIISSANEYAKDLGINLPANCTTLKPEGSLSLLPNVSAGIHYAYAPYYIRRVRIKSSDPLVKVCEDLGYSVVPEVGENAENCTTKVIEFICKSPSGITRKDLTAIQQLENYKMFMDYYVQQNASNTISVKKHEWDEVVDWVHENWDTIVGVTFLADDSTFYPLAPYEEISEEQYHKMYKEVPQITPELIRKYEHSYNSDDDLTDESCSNGICPVR